MTIDDNIYEELVILGDNIYEKRTEKGLSQEQLALDAGVTVSSIYRVERAQVNIRFDNLLKIAKVLECSLEDLCPTKFVDKKDQRKKKNLIDLYDKLSEGEKEVVYEVFSLLSTKLMTMNRI